MLILEAGNIKKYYSDRLIIGFNEIKVYSGDKIGIVGQNGSGKTTLLNLLAKETDADEGFVKHNCDIMYIRQFSDEKVEAAPKVLKEFNLTNIMHQDAFSGGEKTRIKIANAFSSENMLLFADEPTSDLDYKGIELLKSKLSEVESFLLISHDRQLLDSLCNKILEVRDGRIRIFNGNYSYYKEITGMEFQRAEQEYGKYISERTHLEASIVDRQGKSKSIRKAPKRMGNSEARLHRRSATEKQEKINNAANSLKTRLEKLEAKEKPRELPKIKLDFSMTNPPENRIIISAEKLSFRYDSKNIFDNAGFKVYNGQKTALWGENGAGKSTLLNLINSRADKNIYIVPKARIGYFYQGFKNLDYEKTVLENVMEDSVQSQSVARTILARLLITADDVHKKVGILSGGERIKVSFAKLFVSRANVLLLDEPTNFLDMMSIEALQEVLLDYEGTVLFVSHDSAFVNAVAGRLLILGNKSISEFEGNLEEYNLSRQNAGTVVKSDMERSILEMRVTEMISRLSRQDEDMDALEEEYQRLIRQLR